MTAAIHNFARAALLAAVLGSIPAGAALAADGLMIRDLVMSAPPPDARSDATVGSVRAFYDFWNTGDEAYLKQAISDRFTDRTLPAGRPQGPEGPAFATRAFRIAVPDLGVTVHMTFTGHFSGRFGDTAGKGQPFHFIASDLLKVEDARL